MRHRMFAHFNADIASTHFMGHGSGRSRTKEGIQNNIVLVGSKRDNSLHQLFRLWGAKNFCFIKILHFFFCVLIVPDILVKPYSH